MELWDLYDKYRHKTGQVHKRDTPVEEGRYHFVVQIWIINDEGKFLIQKRQPWKIIYPNSWDCAVAGAAISGDDSEASAIREVKEELGLDLNLDTASLILSNRHSSWFADTWLVTQNVNIKDIVLQADEVADVKWVTRKELLEMIHSGDFVNYSYMNTLFEIIDSKIVMKKSSLEKDTSTTLNDYYNIFYLNNLAGNISVSEIDTGIREIQTINIFAQYENIFTSDYVINRLKLLYPQTESWIIRQ